MARPRQVSDVEILSIARACFLEHGPGVSTKLIAEQTGLSHAALFKRFKTKKLLLKRALLPAIPSFVAKMAAGPDPDAALDEQLAALGAEVGAFFESVVPCMMMLLASGFQKDELFAEFDVPPPIRTLMAMTQWFQGAIDQGRIRDKQASALAAGFLGTLHVRAWMMHMNAPGLPSSEDYAREMVDVFMHGLEC